MKKVLLLFILLSFIFITSCKKNNIKYIFFITLDTTRADFIEYNSDTNLTPNLAKLASKGLIFKNAYSLIPITLPSHNSMFYSRYPHELKIYNNGQIRDIKYPTMTQLLRANGYYTGAVISLGVLKKDFGLNKGFIDYNDKFSEGLWYKRAEEVTIQAMKIIDKGKGKKSFFWIHYSDPHEPYFPPIYKGKFLVKFKNNLLYEGTCVDKALIKINLKISPGKNILKLENILPQQLVMKNKFSTGFKNITYIDFKLNPQNKKEITIKYPDDWRILKPRGKTHYKTKELISEIIINNTTNTLKNIKVSFLRSLVLKNKWKKFLYGREIKYMDHWIGELIKYIKQMGIYDESAFVVMGDHGEGLGEFKGHFGHIHYLYKPYSHVPMFVSGMGVKKKGFNNNLVSNLNIAPTILELTGINKPKTMIGYSLFDKNAKHNRLLLETFFPEAYFDVFSLIEYPYQLIFSPGRKKDRLEFINLKKSNIGLDNIIKTNEAGKLRRDMINEILKISRIITATKFKPTKISERQKEILKSLGYL